MFAAFSVIIGLGEAVIPSKGGFPMDIFLPSATAPLYLSHSVTKSCCHCSSLCPTDPSVPGQPQAAGICGQLLATELTLCVAAICVSPLYPAADFLKACQNTRSLQNLSAVANGITSCKGTMGV